MSDTRHTNRPESPTVEELYAEHADRLRRLIGARVKTSDQNMDDACSFAWAQLMDKRPPELEHVFGWLATVATREAWRLARIDRESGSELIEEVVASPMAEIEGVDQALPPEDATMDSPGLKRGAVAGRAKRLRAVVEALPACERYGVIWVELYPPGLTPTSPEDAGALRSPDEAM